MNFDRIAPFYGWMERWLAGGCMQKCRMAFLGEIKEPRRALLMGEGPGRFLKELCDRFPDTDVTVIDGSKEMLEISRRAVGGNPRVEFVNSMIGDWETENRYDLIATHFVLDCFSAERMEEAVTKLAGLATDDADWLLSDFEIPERGISRWRAKWIVGMLYRFFKMTAELHGAGLHPADEALRKNGFELSGKKPASWGLMKGEWWTRNGFRP